ncbi:unnamed protein product, partial [Rotaria sp. Silwood2]
MMNCIRMYWAQRPPTNYREYDSYGPLFAVNEHVAIFAQNDKARFILVKQPYNSSSMWNCTLDYIRIRHPPISTTYFVYSVAIGAKQNSSHLAFTFMDEDFLRRVFLTVVFLEDSSSGCLVQNRSLALDLTEYPVLEDSVVAMDPYGTRAYSIGKFNGSCIDLVTMKTWVFDTRVVYGEWDGDIFQYYPKAITISKDHQIFLVGQLHMAMINQFHTYLVVLNFRELKNATKSLHLELSTFNYGIGAADINRVTTMSIALDESSHTILVGIPRIDTVLFLV